jgi:hypothetical protein
MPRTARTMQDPSLLAAALEGLQLQKQRIDAQIQEVRTLLGKSPGRRGRPPGTATKGGAGRLSASARKRIAAAQKRRWAEYRKSAAAKGE